MSVTKELIEQERQLVNAGKLMDLHLHKCTHCSRPSVFPD